jgi:putative oxidoreductase
MVSLTSTNVKTSCIFYYQFRRFSIMISAWLVGFSFLYSSIHHFANPWFFHRNILAYELLPANGARYAAALIPVFHMLLGSWLISRVRKKLVGKIVAIWLLVMALVQLSAMVRGLTISCGCFGNSGDQVSFFTIIRNVGLAGLALYSGADFVNDSESQGNAKK